MRRTMISFNILFAASVGAAAPAAAADFYAGKQIKVIIGLGAGETYDAYARALSRHMSKHIPGKLDFLNINMPGAGSLKAYNYIYNVAKRDGTEYGTGHRFVPIMPLFGIQGTQFDGTKFGYIGSANREVGVTMAWHTAPVKTLEDMKTHELIVGTTGAGAQLTNFTSVLKTALGARLRVVYGYKTSREIDLAAERGEVQGRAGVSYNSITSARPEWLAEKKINIIIQMGLTKHPDLPNVPNILDVVTNPTDRTAIELLLAPSEMGRPYVTPPEVPAERMAMMPGKEVEALMKRIYTNASPDVVARAKALTADGINTSKKKKKKSAE